MLIEKQQKHLLYHQENFINMGSLLVKIYCHLPSATNDRSNKIYLFPLGKTFDKQIKTTEDQGKTQVDVLENLKSIEGSKAIKYDGD